MGRGGTNLELLKGILDPDKMDLKCGLVKDLEVAKDRSVLRVSVLLLPEEIEIIAKMSWEMVAPDAGLFQFPSIDDVVLVGFCEGHEDEAYVLKRLTSKEDKIPLKAVDGNLVVRSKSGTNAYVQSDGVIHLTNVDDGDERLVLGDTFKEAYSEHLDIDSTHDHIGNLGFITTPPRQAGDYVALKASPVDDEEILSDRVKTEKG